MMGTDGSMRLGLSNSGTSRYVGLVGTYIKKARQGLRYRGRSFQTGDGHSKQLCILKHTTVVILRVKIHVR